MAILTTIFPIFVLIVLGRFAWMKGFFPPAFIHGANRLVYMLAIPALMFRGVANASLKAHFHSGVLVISLACLVAASLTAWILLHWTDIPPARRGAMIHCSFHCNIGYIGFAVAYYFLGSEGFVKIVVLSGFIIFFQNLLGMMVLEWHGADSEKMGAGKKKAIAAVAIRNPLIIATFSGILYSLSGLGLPTVADRTLNILGSMALPMALLLIGATLSIHRAKELLWQMLFSIGVKLLVLPGFAFLAFRHFGIQAEDFLPALIALASPTATVVAILAKELRGDPEFAGQAISTGTLMSALTIPFWLKIAG